MVVEVLLSAMNQNDMGIVEKSNIRSNCIIVNQCDKDDRIIEERNFGKVEMISTKERGLSRSRNMALINSSADVCVLCDDDIVYVDGYNKTIEKAFCELPDADIIVFNVRSINTDVRAQEKLFDRIRRVPKYKMYSSVHIAFRRESIMKANLKFDTRFGAGSGMYSMAEDSLFFLKSHKAGLKAYTYPAVIADLYSDKSTWFRGYNEKYFFDIGAFLQAAFPMLKSVLCFYYPIRLRAVTKMSVFACLKWIWNGIDSYKNNMSYTDYVDGQRISNG